MGDTDTDRFDIYFSGECLEGHDEHAVRDAVARLFRADDATLAKLFSGQRQRIKRSVDRATALKYHKALQAAGAKAIVARATGPVHASDAGSAAPAPATETSPAPATPPAESNGDSGLTLGEKGADLLRPEERPTPAGEAPSTEHLSLAAAGETLGTPGIPEPTVEAPDFALAATGSDLSDADTTPPPAAPDTSSMSLRDGEFDLSDCIPAAASAPDLDLAHLDIDAVGSDLIRDDERPRREAAAPDTSHLRLEDSDDA